METVYKSNPIPSEAQTETVVEDFMPYEQVTKICQEAASVETEPRLINGPVAPDIARVFQDITEQLAEINSLDGQAPQDIFSEDRYRTRQTRLLVRLMPREDRAALDSIRANKNESLIDATREHFKNSDNPQTIKEGLLAVPPYVRSNDLMACVPACVSMIWSDCTGETISPYNMYNSVNHEYVFGDEKDNTSDDASYLKLLLTPSFTEASGRLAQTATITGADFDQIGRAAERVQQMGKRMYCILIKKSESIWGYSGDVLHAVVLLSANDKEVICHDPRGKGGEASKHFDREEFLDRWAVGLNRAHLVITD